MSVGLFHRGLQWRKQRDNKVREQRTALAEERGFDAGAGAGAASAAEHVDSFWEYTRLVGDADGGTLLPPEQYAVVKQLAAAAAANRLFPVWRCLQTGVDCYSIGPDSRCFCGHSYKSHAW